MFSGKAAKDHDFLGRYHGMNAANNARTLRFMQQIDSAGTHLLKISMIDPTVVVQKVIVQEQPLPPSYFGPPERPINGPSTH